MKFEKLYTELSSRETNNSKMYIGILAPIINDVEDILQYIKNIFPDYPDHGIKHSSYIIDYIFSILGNSVKKLTDTECFCFALSALFHDTGMALVGYDRKDALRDKHHYNASIVIRKYFDEKLSILSSSQRIKSVVEFVCEAHGLALGELYDDSRFSKEDTINGDRVRYSFLAILLRIGDLMDLDENRVSCLALKMFPEYFSEEAKEHNLRHLRVECYNYNPDRIDIQVSSDNIRQYKIWHTWFEYLKNDILRANTYLRELGVSFPLPKTHILTSPEADYSAEEIHFEIDDKGGIWNILSQSIYTNELDFLREIVQNAIDATLMTIYANTEISLNSPSPRSWDVKTHCVDIKVCYSEEQNELFVIDQGIGMNCEELRKFLFKVSSSGYTEANKRNFSFPSIAKYGIGFVSCLICADEIEIYTSKAEESVTHKVSLDTKSNLAFMENSTSYGYNGTTIVLKLKNGFTFNKISDYIKNTFLYPSIGISIVNLDLMKRNCEKLSTTLDYNVIKKNPTLLINSIKQTLEHQKIHIAPLIDRMSVLQKIAFDAEKLKIQMQKNYQYNPQYTTSQRTANIRKNLIKFLENVLDEELKEKFPYVPEKINDKAFFDMEDTYVEKLEEYTDLIYNEINTVFKARNEYPTFIEYLCKDTVSFNLEHKYMIIFLNKDFTIESVELIDHPIDLSNRMGIVFMTNSEQDFKLGLEYATINGFLFNEGKISTSLVKLVGEYCVPFSTTKQKSFVVDFSGYTTIKDSIYETVCMDMYDLEEEPIFIPSDDNSYDLGIQIIPTCDVVYIKNNMVMKDLNVDINFTHNYLNDLQGRPFSLLNHFNSEKYAQAISQWDKLDQAESIYCQDGIIIPDELSTLFPVGYFKIMCNTTFMSRKVLNVTRHETSQLHSDIDCWLEDVGFPLQYYLLSNVIKTLESFNLEVDFSNISKNCTTNSYFAQKCHYNFDRILSKY